MQRMCSRKFGGSARTQMLSGNRSSQLMFDGSIERVSCITQHDDFSSMTNRSVLLQVGPLLSDKNGRGYRRRDGQTESQ